MRLGASKTAALRHVGSGRWPQQHPHRAPQARRHTNLWPGGLELGGGGNGQGGGVGGGGGDGGRGDRDDSPGGGRNGAGWQQAALAAVACTAQQLLTAGDAQAAAKGKGKQPANKELTVDSVVDTAWTVAGPVLTNLGFSGTIGVAAGMALKTLGRFVAVSIGLLFVLLQGLAISGFITVNWAHVHRRVHELLDVDRDGKLGEKDFKVVATNVLGVLAQGVPSVGGFLAGFVMGVRL